MAKVQVTQEELAGMTSLTAVQTRGLKRSLVDLETVGQVLETPDSSRKINSVAGGKKKRQWREEECKEDDEACLEPADVNVIGLNVREDSSSESGEEEENMDKSLWEENETANSEPVSEKEQPQNSEVINKKQNEQTIPNDSDTNPVIPQPKAPVCESKPAVYVHVYRSEEVQTARSKLPIIAEEQAIVEAINSNPVVILAGETGSGKTTQVKT